jgi:hypothetical protein
MTSLDPKITLAVYIGGAVIFVCVMIFLVVFTMKTRTSKAVLDAKGRKEVSVEEGIAIATEGTHHPKRNL